MMDVPETSQSQECGYQEGRAELVTGREKMENGTELHTDTAICAECDMTQQLDSNVVSGVEMCPSDREEGVGVCQEERGGDGPCELVPYQFDRHPLQPKGEQYFWRRVSCTGNELAKMYCQSRKLLGSNVIVAHVAWHRIADDESIHPVIKACALSFSVISTPETIPYVEQYWHALQQQMVCCTPDYEIASFMVQYALAWAYEYQPRGHEKALKMLLECYQIMVRRGADNFFLAPFYTVTIGRWIYETHIRNCTLTDAAMNDVLAYIDETLRLIDTLEDVWAITDTFGVRVSVFYVMMLAEQYYMHCHPHSEMCQYLHLRIGSLMSKLDLCLSQWNVLIYDQAWYHGARATYLKNNCNSAECKASAFTAALLYKANGRHLRALQEARHSGNEDLVKELEQKSQVMP